MEKQYSPVTAVVETWKIPTYPSPEADEMPAFAERRGHQGTSGDPYPNRLVNRVDREHRAEKEYTVIRLENDFIRVAVIPELGGRIFEAFDKTTGYNFLYRQHVIKPALIGAFGSWISGGIEFNWPYHHRPSTLMPVDYKLEKLDDGSAIVWLSEHDPIERTKGMVGVVLRPDASYFETRMQVTNRTPYAHSFLWWENAAVAVHEGYRLVFPPDVTWVHHHYDFHHTTFPIAQGTYSAEEITTPKDISWHKNSRVATSYFAAPSKYDFFGGYDYRAECGILHIANHHVSPGKKMFTWGYGANAENWEAKLTDTDGQYAELMAGSFTDDQPDFTWLAPYETKSFSQFWYPTQGIGYTTYATLDAAVAFDREKNEVRVNATGVYEGARLTVSCAECGKVLLDETLDLKPSAVATFALDFPEGKKLTVVLTDAEGDELLSYTEEDADYVHIPKNNPGRPHPGMLSSAGALTIAGRHVDQYRDPLYEPDEYYLKALEKDPDCVEALTLLGEYYCRRGRYNDALPHLEKAEKLQCTYNPNPEDGRVRYFKAMCLRALGKIDEAYDTFYKAAWSQNVISPAMTEIAAIDGVRGNYGDMIDHALQALEKESNHVIAASYAALAMWRCGLDDDAKELLRSTLEIDPLNHLARYALVLVSGKGLRAFYDRLFSNPAQTCLDVGFDLLRAGFVDETIALLEGVLNRQPRSAMARYTLAYCYELRGEGEAAARERAKAPRYRIVEVFPCRDGEVTVLEDALDRNPKDGFAAYLLGCFWQDRRKYERAAALYEVAIREMPRFYIPYRNLALINFNRLGNTDEALRLLRRAIALHPKDECLLSEIAEVMGKSQMPRDEIAAYLEANCPDDASDGLILKIARAYNAASDYQNAHRVMLSHQFYPSEGGEYATAEPYMYAHFAAGRVLMKDGRFEEALAEFRLAQEIPENLHTGFWNESVLMPYRYYEAAALKALGKTDEANAIIEAISKLKNAGMWNMGAEFTYYAAMAVRLAGDELRARDIMRKAILAWEGELAGGCTYHRYGSEGCFLFDPVTLRRATLSGMLGYGKLYNGDLEGARDAFRTCLALDPSNYKIALDLSLI